MRFQYVDRSGRKVEVQSLEGLAARLELGAITPETMLYDAVADRWAPAAEHEFFRSLVRPQGRESTLPVTPPGLMPSMDSVEPVVGPAEEATDGPPESDAPGPDGTPEEPAAGEASSDPSGDGVYRSPEPSARASFSEVKEGAGSAHNALFGLLDLEGPGADEIPDPFTDDLELSVLPEAPQASPPSGDAPAEPSAEDRFPHDELSDDVLPGSGSPPASGGEGGLRELTLEDLGGGDDPFADSPPAPRVDAARGGGEAQSAPGGGPTGDWRAIPGGPPPVPLKGPEPAPPDEEEVEGYFRATRSGTATMGGGTRTAASRGGGVDLTPLVRNGVVVLALVALVWFVGGRWGPWAGARERIPAELQTPFAAAWNGAYADMLATMDSMGRARNLPERPGRDWLEGVYLAYASRFAAEGDYWAGLGALIRDLRLAEDSIFGVRIRTRVGGLRLSDAQEALLLAEALRRFEEGRPDRARVYAQAEGIAAAAAELHGLLVQHEEEILYEPFTVSGVSRDPVIEAVPTNRPLAETMWSLIDRVTRGLQDMDAIMGVSTRSFVDAVLRGLRNADPTRTRPPGSPSPGG
jgi:hypothetical protein